MARKHSDLPTLFQRTAHGNYCFRRMGGNKRITINTGTGDIAAAKKFLKNYLSGESAMAFAAPASNSWQTDDCGCCKSQDAARTGTLNVCHRQRMRHQQKQSSSDYYELNANAIFHALVFMRNAMYFK